MSGIEQEQEFDDSLVDENLSVSTNDTDNSQAESARAEFMENEGLSGQQKEQIIQYVDDLKCKKKRAKALQELSKNREYFQDLAPYIWHSVGTISAL